MLPSNLYSLYFYNFNKDRSGGVDLYVLYDPNTKNAFI